MKYTLTLSIIPEKIDLNNDQKSPIGDNEIEHYLASKELSLTVTTKELK